MDSSALALVSSFGSKDNEFFLTIVITLFIMWLALKASDLFHEGVVTMPWSIIAPIFALSSIRVFKVLIAEYILPADDLYNYGRKMNRNILFKSLLFSSLLSFVLPKLILNILSMNFSEKSGILIKKIIYFTLKYLHYDWYHSLQMFTGIIDCESGFNTVFLWNKAGCFKCKIDNLDPLAFEEGNHSFKWHNSLTEMRIIKVSTDYYKCMISRIVSEREQESFTIFSNTAQTGLFISCLNCFTENKIGYFLKNPGDRFGHILSCKEIFRMITINGETPGLVSITAERKFFTGSKESNVLFPFIVSLFGVIPVAFCTYYQLIGNLLLASICVSMLVFHTVVMSICQSNGNRWVLKYLLYKVNILHGFCSYFIPELKFCDIRNPIPHKFEITDLQNNNMINNKMGLRKIIVLSGSTFLDGWHDFGDLPNRINSEGFSVSRGKIGNVEFLLTVDQTAKDIESGMCSLTAMVGGVKYRVPVCDVESAHYLMAIFHFWGTDNNIGVLSDENKVLGKNFIHLYSVKELIDLLRLGHKFHPKIMFTYETDKIVGAGEEIELFSSDFACYRLLCNLLPLKKFLVDLIYEYLSSYFVKIKGAELDLNIVESICLCLNKRIGTKKPSLCRNMEWKICLSDISKILKESGAEKINRISIFKDSKAKSNLKGNSYFGRNNEKKIFEIAESFFKNVKNEERVEIKDCDVLTIRKPLSDAPVLNGLTSDEVFLTGSQFRLSKMDKFKSTHDKRANGQTIKGFLKIAKEKGIEDFRSIILEVNSFENNLDAVLKTQEKFKEYNLWVEEVIQKKKEFEENAIKNKTKIVRDESDEKISNLMDFSFNDGKLVFPETDKNKKIVNEIFLSKNFNKTNLISEYTRNKKKRVKNIGNLVVSAPKAAANENRGKREARKRSNFIMKSTIKEKAMILPALWSCLKGDRRTSIHKGEYGARRGFQFYRTVLMKSLMSFPGVKKVVKKKDESLIKSCRIIKYKETVKTEEVVVRPMDYFKWEGYTKTFEIRRYTPESEIRLENFRFI